MTDEFRHRLGCGLIAAIGLPAWFGVMALALGREADTLAVGVALVLFAVSAVIGVSALRRLRVLPTAVALDRDGWLRITGRRLSLALPADAVVEVEVGASVGLESVRLHTRQGRTIRMPGDIGDFDGFLAALRAAHPALVVNDHREPPGDVRRPGRGEPPGAGGRTAGDEPPETSGPSDAADEPDDDG